MTVRRWRAGRRTWCAIASLALVGGLLAACSSSKPQSTAQSETTLPIIQEPEGSSTSTTPPTSAAPGAAPPQSSSTQAPTPPTTIKTFLRPASERSADPSVGPLPGELAPIPTPPADPPELKGKIGLPAGSSSQIVFYFTLPTDDATLATAAKAMSTPGTGSYRHFFTSYADAARAYGANPNDILTAVRSVEAKGLSPLVDPSRTFVRVSATRDQWAHALGAPLAFTKATADVPFDFYGFQSVPTFDKLKFVGAAATMYVPGVDGGGRRSGASVQNAAIINNRTDVNAKPAGGTAQAAAWPVNAGSHPANTCLANSASGKDMYSPSQIAAAYQTTIREENPATRAVRVAVISLGGGFANSDVQGAAQCFGYKAPTIQVMTGDGVSAPIKNNDEETQLDLQTMAPYVAGGTIQLIEATNGPASLLDATSRMLGDPNGFPDGGSISYAQCAVQERQSNLDLMNAIARVMLVGMTVGSSVFAAAGDWGSAMCPESVKGTSQAFAASAPWVTAIGGTRLLVTPDNQRAKEIVWNDTAYGIKAATGGGVSKVFKRPYYQANVTTQTMRVVPDFSALAAISPGWPVMLGGQMQTMGGTSGSSPFGMAKLALLSASERLAGRPRVGFVNPWIYQLYQQHPEFFYDVTEGSNDLDRVGCCTARPGFDEVSGLGIPIFGEVASHLPPPSP